MTTAANLIENNVWAYMQVQCALDECSADLQDVVKEMLEIFRSSDSTKDEQQLAVHTIVDLLFPSVAQDLVDDARRYNLADEGKAESSKLTSEEDFFSKQVSKLMGDRELSQTDLAARIGVSQSAISNLLSRKCRPQARTVKKIAEALGVEEALIWPSNS